MAEYQLADLPCELRDRIEVDPDSGCWLWRGRVADYGYVYWNGQGHAVHRLVFSLLAGPIPAGLAIDHVRERGCRSKACCSPAHLEPVTRAENSRRGALVERLETWRGLPVLTVSRARDSWTSLVAGGRPAVITRRHRPAAVLVPVSWYEEAEAALASAGDGPDTDRGGSGKA